MYLMLTYIAVARKVRMLESFSAQMDTLYRQVSTACRAGMTTGNDLLRIEAERSDVLYQLQKAKNGEDLCRKVKNTSDDGERV